MSDAHSALTAIGQLPDDEIDLADAALHLARAGDPAADWKAARTHLSELAQGAAALSITIDPDDLVAQARALHGLLARTHTYEGDVATYNDLANANLIHVIERRQGLPVALGIIWLHAAHAAGWNAHGIDFPGHFLIALAHGKDQVVLDPFNGGNSLSMKDLRRLLQQVEGNNAHLRPALLTPMSRRAVLIRLQNNIRTRLLEAGHLRDALACAEATLAIAPDDPTLQHHAAELRARLN